MRGRGVFRLVAFLAGSGGIPGFVHALRRGEPAAAAETSRMGAVRGGTVMVGLGSCCWGGEPPPLPASQAEK